MSKFITGKQLVDAVEKIIWEADERLMIVSPYIKLDDHFRKLFVEHLHKPNLHITVIFGKNESKVNKSFSKNDFDFFLQFPNISIVYVPNLHAKYYANDLMGVVTSINLYDYSFVNNIEFGVLYEYKLLSLSNSSDDDVWDACQEIANTNEVIFIRRPIIKKGMLGMSKTYMGSKVLLDRTSELYSGKALAKGSLKLNDFEDVISGITDYNDRPVRETTAVPKPAAPTTPIVKPEHEPEFVPGFCIRTRKKIPFNPEAPFSLDAYKSWAQWGNPEFVEKFCHYSGEPSNGETCYSRPILYKNWKKAKEFNK